MITQAEVRALFDYDPVTGVLSRGGIELGWLEISGYRRVNAKGRRYMAHVIIWLWMTGEMPPYKGIDHRNTNPGDNRWDNLRLATGTQNKANTKVRADNRLGIKGVRLHECGRYQARIFNKGRHHSLGLFSTANEASAAYSRAAKELFGDFARSA